MASRLREVAALIGHEDYQTVPWHQVRYQHVAAVRTALQERGQAPATVNLTLAALRGVAKAAFNLGLTTADDYQRVRNVPRVRGERLPRGRALEPGEIGALMRACAKDPGPAGVRDAALIALLYAAGLRRAEARGLDLADYDPDKGELVVRGKGNKERLLHVNDGPADALADWLTIRGEEPGALFLPINKGGRVIRERGGRPVRLTDQAVYNALRKRAKEAGVKAFSPHDLRRSFVSDLLDAGADISVVQKLAGHANVQTTTRYDRRGEEAKKKAVRLLHVPYRRRSPGGSDTLQERSVE
jgi:site-specific recombinase XerD